MPRIKTTRGPSLSDKQAFRELFYRMPLIERGKPIMPELLWVLLGRRDAEQHNKILPDYCYNIFNVVQKTFFKGFPLLSETVMVTDQPGLQAAKTIEAAKKVLRIDWKNLGRLFGIGARCLRYAELEAADGLKREVFNDLTPEAVKDLFTIFLGKQWVEDNTERINVESASGLAAEILNQRIAPWAGDLKQRLKFADWAYQWSPSAMAELNKGMAEGMTSFVDVNGEFAHESNRSGIYILLLLAWPEIKAMLESSPKKTLSDLHEWMQPFMRIGVTAYIEIETLRDVCAPAPSGIGLSLRPLKTQRRKSSA